jgi:hypothetical protein
MAHRQHVVATGEDVDLARPELVARHLDSLQHHEQRIAVLLDLRPLVAVARVLHRELVQIELLLHLLQLGFGGVAQPHPHEAPRPREIVADLALVDVGELAAVLVSDAVNEHEKGVRAIFAAA